MSNGSMWGAHPFDPGYLPAVVRNLATLLPGTISVIILSVIIYHRPYMYQHYKLTVVFLTYVGYALSIPIIIFNLFMVVAIPTGPLAIDTVVCSVVKQFVDITMNVSFAVYMSMAAVRYVVVMFNKEWGGKHLLTIFAVLATPMYIRSALAFVYGDVAKNDECPYYIDIDWEYLPLVYYTYLSVLVVGTDYCNIRVMLYLLYHKRILKKLGTVQTSDTRRRARDQLSLSVGLLVQSAVVSVCFGSTILFMLLFSYKVVVPDWLSTITNTLSSLSTLLNPLAASIFVRSFRREIIRAIFCLRPLSSLSTMAATTSQTAVVPFRKRRPSVLSVRETISQPSIRSQRM